MRDTHTHTGKKRREEKVTEGKRGDGQKREKAANETYQKHTQRDLMHHSGEQRKKAKKDGSH